MKKILIQLTLCLTLVHSDVIIPKNVFIGQTVVADDSPYYIHKQEDIDIIYSKDNLPFAKHTSKIEKGINKSYKHFYDWSLDESLSIGLVSKNNQIANGFSTQYPNNIQINYLGGTSAVDYFTSKSWLDTLLFHEGAHTYQLNVKNNVVSKSLHSIFGNGTFFIQTFTVPNIAVNSFMLEGNAVLNESWHGNGGRLYNGRLYAQTLLQAKANKIKAGEVYNAKVEFPYSEIVYIQGGFYNLYMAEKYGLQAINSFFKFHSQDWLLPAFTNKSMKKATGIDFESSLKDFSDIYKKRSEFLVMAQGEKIASSQYFYQLNSDSDEIFFMTNESATRAPELMRFNKNDNTLEAKRDSYSASKVIKVDGDYYTQGSAKISSSKIVQGLFDNNKFLKEGTDSKMLQGYLSDGKEVYFDVPLSYSEPQLFIDGVFYAQVNSSVFIDKQDNLYYFIQEGKRRTLYKNKIPLMHLDAYYGFVNDVDSKGGIYFIANSQYGSSLYKYANSQVSRVSKADNIVEARLINDTDVLIGAISDKDYYYVKTKLEAIAETPYQVKYFFEDKDYFSSIQEQTVENIPDTSREYNSFLDMRYSGLDFTMFNSPDGIVGTLNLKYADPLGQNAVNAFINRSSNSVTIAGAGYESALNTLRYGIYGYGVIENSQKNYLGEDIAVRDKGILAFGELPLYEKGYYKAALNASYYQDYNTYSREPLSLSFSLSRYERYGKSMYSNYAHAFTAYMAKERKDSIYGIQYTLAHDLPKEFYISLESKYSRASANISSLNAQLESRGVKLSTSSYSSDLDSSVIGMRSARGSAYFKNAGYVDIGIKKVFNFSSYWFTFPFSLQREVLHFNYKYFNLEDFNNNTYNVREVRAGLTASVVFLNSLIFPITLEYIRNDSYIFGEEKQVLFSTGLSF